MENKAENNKLIARFMGFESAPFENKGGKGFSVTLIGMPKDNCTGSYSLSCYGDLEYNIEKVLRQNFKYDKCWNWLMPVVEKIGKDYVIEIMTTPTISGKWVMHKVTIETPSWKENVIVELGSDYDNNESKISITYKGVIEFIKWYNENNLN